MFAQVMEILQRFQLYELFLMAFNRLLLIFSRPIFNKLSHRKLDKKISSDSVKCVSCDKCADHCLTGFLSFTVTVIRHIYDINQADIRNMFNSAFEIAIQDASVDVESHHPLEIMPSEAGDNAVVRDIYYYTKDIRNLIVTRQQLLSIILKQAAKAAIILAMPMLHVVDSAAKTELA